MKLAHASGPEVYAKAKEIVKHDSSGIMEIANTFKAAQQEMKKDVLEKMLAAMFGEEAAEEMMELLFGKTDDQKTDAELKQSSSIARYLHMQHEICCRVATKITCSIAFQNHAATVGMCHEKSDRRTLQ
jgi:hypothetical protein